VSGERTDAELLALGAAGDQEAFWALVKRHEGRVLNLALRFTRDRQDAEELAQDVFFKVWRHARSFRGESSFGTWLYRVAVNACLNFKQRMKARPSPLPLADDLEASNPRAADGLDADERETRLKSALDALPARQRLALVLASFEDKSYEEIAEAMEVSVAAVESLIFRARRNLAAILRPLREKGEI